MSLAILFHFLCAQHVSYINISIIRILWIFCWITTLVVLFLVRCVLEFRCGWFGVVSVLQASACWSFIPQLSFFLSFQLSLDFFLPIYLGAADYGCTWTHTVTHKLVRSSLEEGSARRRDRYLITHNTHNRHIHATGEIRTHKPSKGAAVDTRLKPESACSRTYGKIW